jgi:phage tail protein X
LDSYIEYETDAGDTFDILALNFYDNEFKSHIIMEANPQHIDMIVLPAGLKLIIPIIDIDPAETLPPWKR